MSTLTHETAIRDVLAKAEDPAPVVRAVHECSGPAQDWIEAQMHASIVIAPTRSGRTVAKAAEHKTAAHRRGVLGFIRCARALSHPAQGKGGAR